MPKVVTSPVKRWPGSVTLFDPVPWPQYTQWKAAITGAPPLADDYDAHSAALLPGVCACVAEWHLDGLPNPVTPETFPAMPRRSSDRLLGWLVGQIAALNDEADDTDPK